MKQEYFVMCKKDFRGENLQENKKKREIYDKKKDFFSLEEATEFALENIHQLPILARATLKPENDIIKDKDKPFVLAAYFEAKYFSYGYDGRDNFPTFEITRCSQDRLESELEELAQEKPDKIYFGVELKLLP